MRNLSQHFFEQAAKEQAARNAFYEKVYEAQHRHYEDEQIREEVRRCVERNAAHNPYNPNPSSGC